jgi:hypothetical protein
LNIFSLLRPSQGYVKENKRGSPPKEAVIL